MGEGKVTTRGADAIDRDRITIFRMPTVLKGFPGGGAIPQS